MKYCFNRTSIIAMGPHDYKLNEYAGAARSHRAPLTLMYFYEAATPAVFFQKVLNSAFSGSFKIGHWALDLKLLPSNRLIIIKIEHYIKNEIILKANLDIETMLLISIKNTAFMGTKSNQKARFYVCFGLPQSQFCFLNSLCLYKPINH